jgi:hypothetical protein
VAEFRVRSDHQDVNHVSTASADLDVVDGVVDMSEVSDEDRRQVEVELSEVSVLERVGEVSERVERESEEASDEQEDDNDSVAEEDTEEGDDD